MEVMSISKDSGSNAGAGSGFGFPDYSKADRSELLGLMAQADMFRRQAEAYLVGLVVRFGELEGQAAAATVCHQLGISAYRARRLARMAEGLAAMPGVLRAAEQGLISADQAGLVAESHKRAPMSDLDQQELVELGGWQGQDEFKKTVAAREDQRRADDGMGRTERQRARRSAKVFDGTGGMVVLHAELDQMAGERVKTALCSMSSKMLGDDIAHDPIRTFEQRNADALVALITQQPAAGTATQGGGGFGPGGTDCEGIAAPAPQKTVLIVSADYDAITGQLKNCGLIDGTPIELDELRRLACDAEILPMIFAADGQPVYVGRTPKSSDQSPETSPLPQRQRLHRLRHPTAGLRRPPHLALGAQRAHRHHQPGAVVPQMPHQSSQTRPHHPPPPRNRPIPTHPTQPGIPRSASPPTPNSSLSRPRAAPLAPRSDSLCLDGARFQEPAQNPE